ncbi:MAG: ROK family transcriptional regulator [Anaerolineales bacterium]
MNRKSIKQTSIREINLSSTLYCLKNNAPLSRADLAKFLDLSKASVSNIVNDLIEKELLFEVGLLITGSGNPAKLLEINPRAGDIIGLEISYDFIRVVRCDFSGNIIWQKSADIESLDSPDEILHRSLNLVVEARSIQRSLDTKLLGLGISVSGLVDYEQGKVVSSSNTKLNNLSIKNFFSEKLDFEVFLENNSNASALGEHFFGAAQDTNNFVFVSLSRVVRGGVFLNGEIYRGGHGYAGEIGHVPYSLQGGKKCRCGNFGCWETECNEYSLIERMNSRVKINPKSLMNINKKTSNEKSKLQTIINAADENDVEAMDILIETGTVIGVGVSSLLNIFDPEMVVLGGSVSYASKFLIKGIKMSLEKHTHFEIRKHMNLVLSQLNADASVLGAVAMVAKDVFDSPSKYF